MRTIPASSTDSFLKRPFLHQACPMRASFLVIPLLVLCASAQTPPGLWPPVVPGRSAVDPPPASATLLPGKRISINAVAVDSQNNAYLAGTGSATDVPGLDRGFDATPDGGDAFIAKVDGNGSIVWSTYLGGTDQLVLIGSRLSAPFPDTATAIAVDNAGQVYVAGSTSATNFPTVNAFQSDRRGIPAAFVAKLSADGRRLLYASYIGDNRDAVTGRGIAVGPAGEVWIEVTSTSTTLPVTTCLSGFGACGPVVVMKLNPAGTPIWSTRLGLREPGGFGIDGSGRTYVSGPLCNGVAPPCNHALVRLDSSGTHLDFQTRIPDRNAAVFESSLAVLPGGRVAFSSVAFDPIPLRNNLYQPPECAFGLGGCGQVFVAIATDAGELETASYVGLGESQPRISADLAGRITLAVQTRRPELPVVRALLDHHVDGPIYVSRDRATTWTVEGRTTLPGINVLAMVFNGLRGGVTFAANGIYDTRDEATTWRLDTTAGQCCGASMWFRIAVDPRRPSIRYGIFEDHVFRHDDGAAQWRQVYRSPLGTYRRTVVVSPHDSSVWIAGNAGVATSANGGDSWIDRSAGLPQLNGTSPTVEDLEFDPRRAGVVYALTQVGVYRTVDNGATWQPITSGFSPPAYAKAIAFDPIDAQTMHVATLNYGLLKSTTDGQSWTRRLETSRITVVETDHMKRHVVYAGGVDADGHNRFYRSIDHGDTFHDANAGLDMRGEPSRLVVDPRDSMTLYLATANHQAVPYVICLAPAMTRPGQYAAEFASYLGHGEIRAVASTISGGLVLALNHAPPGTGIDQQQAVIVRIAP